MKTARSTALGAALLAAAALTLSACGPNNSSDASGGKASASPTPSPTPAPKDQLAKAVKALDSTSEKVSITSGGKSVMSGSVDTPNKGVDVLIALSSGGVSIKYEVLAVGTDQYAKWDLGSAGNRQYKIDPKKWYKIDASKVTDKSSLIVDPTTDFNDPLNLESALSALADVKSTDGLTFTGTIDLDAASDSVLSDVTTDDISKLGDKVKAVPFTATVNAQGQLASFKTDGTGISPALTEDIEFTDFGNTKVTAPATAVAAPASLYSLLNG